jgi:hypothetical protein
MVIAVPPSPPTTRPVTVTTMIVIAARIRATIP